MAPNALSTVFCTSSSVSSNDLYNVHRVFCHPGVTRLYHCVRTKTLPYSLNEICKMIANCEKCAEVKPQFYKRIKTYAIKATMSLNLWSALVLTLKVQLLVVLEIDLC